MWAELPLSKGAAADPGHRGSLLRELGWHWCRTAHLLPVFPRPIAARLGERWPCMSSAARLWPCPAVARAGVSRLLVPQDVQLFLTLGKEALEAEVLPNDWQQLLQQLPLPQTLWTQE